MALIEHCLCKATDLHTLSDFVYQTTLTVPANTRTRIYHKHLRDGGVLEAGDTVRYVPVDTLVDGSTACPQWSSYASTDYNSAGQGFGGVLQGPNNEIYVDVNFPDLDGSDTLAEREFCYLKTVRRRKLQVVANPVLRGGGLVIVTVRGPPSPPPMPPLPGTCDQNSEVTKPVDTAVFTSDVGCLEAGNANPEVVPGTALFFCPTVADTSTGGGALPILALPYPRCLPTCTLAEHERVSSCITTCPLGWWCCASLGMTCIQNGDVCPECPDCASATDTGSGEFFQVPTPSGGERQCYLNMPPSAPPSPLYV